MKWRALHQEAAVLDRRVQEIKGSRRRHQGHLDVFDQESVVLKKQKAEGEGRLAQAVERVRTENQVLADKLMLAVNEDEKVLIEGVSPTIKMPSIIQADDTPLPHMSLSLRPRPVPHP